MGIMPKVIRREFSPDALVAVESLPGAIYTGEGGAHTFRIHGPAAFTGTVLVKILRPDNITVDIQGTIEDGDIVATLLSDAYHVPGRVSIVVYNTDGNNTIVVYAAVMPVCRATSGHEIDSGVNIPSLAELLANIADCEAAAA